MSVDLGWMSKGGLLQDGSGDIAFTVSPLQCLKDMAYTRLKATLNAWKLYPMIGADLDSCPGQTVAAELETTIQRQVTAAFTQDFLPYGSFTVKTVPMGSTIQVFVFLDKTLIATTTVTK